jgi:hypothetical protein
MFITTVDFQWNFNHFIVLARYLEVRWKSRVYYLG